MFDQIKKFFAAWSKEDKWIVVGGLITLVIFVTVIL